MDAFNFLLTPPLLPSIMNIHDNEQPFRLLDLPRELRDEIYEHALGFYSCWTDPSTINDYARVHAKAHIVKRRRLGINILLANKQIHDEAFPIIMKTNLLVRVEVRNSRINKWLHGPTQPIHILSMSSMGDASEREEKIKKHSGYAMELVIQTQQTTTEYHRRPAPSVILMLWADLGEFCKRLEVERMSTRSGNPNRQNMHCVQINVKLNSGLITRAYGGDMNVLSTRSIHEQLLRPLRDGIRGSPDLAIEGCIDETLVQETIQAVGQPYWPDSQNLLNELYRHRAHAGDAWLNRNDLQRVAACADGISLIDRLSINMTEYRAHELPPYIHAVLGVIREYHYYFHITIARCLLAHLKKITHEDTYSNVEELSAIYADMNHVLEYIAVPAHGDPDGHFRHPFPWFPTFEYRYPSFPNHEAHFLLSSAGRILLEQSVVKDDEGRAELVEKTRRHLRRAFEVEWENKVYKEEMRRLVNLVGIDLLMMGKRPFPVTRVGRGHCVLQVGVLQLKTPLRR
jgi:hypothetical protein